MQVFSRTYIIGRHQCILKWNLINIYCAAYWNAHFRWKKPSAAWRPMRSPTPSKVLQRRTHSKSWPSQPHLTLPTQPITSRSPTMRAALLALFVSLALATPHPWAAPAAASSVVPTPVQRNRTHHHHHEKTPTFKEPCECAMPIVPMNLLSANEKCLMKHAAQMGCYLGSKGGCPSPAPAVSV
jgi:hypothetical protein